MATRRVPGRGQARTPYWLRFSLMLLSLGVITSTFVLVVLPRRFVLQAGLVESGITFPAHAPPFSPPRSRPIVTPPPGETLDSIPLGPAEAFWNAVLPLLKRGEYETALTMFRRYLAEYPSDLDVWREYAVALTRAGRTAEARTVYGRLLSGKDDPSVKLELARLARDVGDYDLSLALYRELVETFPDDRELYHEFARALVWAEQYREARSVYSTLLREYPDDYPLRLELAQVLYWDNRPVGAYLTLRNVPADVHESEEGTGLRLLLDSLLLASMPPCRSPIDRARTAVAENDLARAGQLYRRVLFSHPTDPDVWVEWLDFLQYQVEDLPAALQALLGLEALRDLTPDEQYRLAQLHMWAGNEVEAEAALERLLESHPERADAWAMLGDLYQWRGSRITAKRAYERSLALSPDNPVAAAGLDSLMEQTYRTIALRENPSVGTRMFYFQDSDEYGRLDLIAQAGYLRHATAVVVRAGYRRLEGIELDGEGGVDQGPFAEVELAHWLRLGTVRASLTAGIERLDAFGNQPSLEAKLSVPNASGTGITALYRHGPAFSQTITFESVQASLLTDYLEASAFRRIGTNWTLAVNGTVGSLHTTGNGNLRTTVGAAAVYGFSRVVSAGITTQYLTFADSAPRFEDRRLYWDPKTFWATGVRLQLSTIPESPWNLYARVTPGVALDNERDGSDTQWVPQLASEAGIRFENKRLILAGDLAYIRGREGGYNSFGANLLFAVKY